MKTVKLDDLVDFSNGYAFKSTDYVDSSNTANCRMSNIRPDGSFDIEYNIKYLPDSFADKYSSYLLNDGDIIIAMTDMADDPKILGVPTIVNTKGYRVLMNQRVGKLTLKTDDLDSGYLKYYLMSDYARNYFKSFSGGGVQLNISKKDILNIDIKLCEIEKQKYICEIFEKINSLIIANNEQLSKLDELVKSRFIELFGNLVIGDKINTNKLKIGDIASVTKLAGFEFTKYIQYKEHGDIIMLRGLNCKKGYLVLDDIKWIDKETSDLLPRSKLYYGDILMTYAGTIGDVAMVDVDDKYHLAPNVAKITLNDKNACNPVFLMHLFMYTNDYIMTFASVVAQASINMEKIRSFEYYFPSVEVQNQFAAFVEQTDKLKLEVKESLEKLETLKKSLMQKYFG